jgi:cysteine desulfurase
VLRAEIPETNLNGDPQRRLPNNVSISFAGVDAESLLLRLDMAGICAAAGSACTSGALEPSHVLMALGLQKDLAKSSIRLTLGRENGPADIEKLLKLMPEIVKDLRERRRNRS